MTSKKRLNSVAQSLSHHAASGMSYLNPHLGEACKKSKIYSVSIDVLKQDNYPDVLGHSKPLKLALKSLRQTCVNILAKEGFSVNEINNITMNFNFLGVDDHSPFCRTTITDTGGKTYSAEVDSLGRTIWKMKG
jgi:hypothetical protein